MTGARVGRPYRRLRYLVSLLLALGLTAGCSSGLPPVVFTSDRDGNLELYSVDVDSKLEQNLTASPLGEFSPALSPDGKMVAFLSGGDESTSIEVIQVDGTGRQKLTTGSGRHRDQRWSPRSDRLAYVKEDGSERLAYVVNADGSQPLTLSSIPANEVGSWSPDGKSVLFAVRGSDAQGIYMRNPDGVNEFRLSDTPDFSPIWSPDSERIAFLSERDGNPELYVMNADGTEQRRLTENDALESRISWSPDGKKLLFVSDRDGNPEIYVADIEDSTQTRLTHNDVRDDEPVWSPKGKKIAFVSFLDDDPEIFVMDADGGNQVRLTNNTFQDFGPSW